MYFKEILLFFIPFFCASILHLYFCIMCKKKEADVLKLILMPLLLIPVFYAKHTFCLPAAQTFILSGAILGAWAGDYFLIKPVSKKKFFYGLISFFVSHVCYLAIFMPQSPIRSIPGSISMGSGLLYLILTAVIYIFIGKPKGLRGAGAVVYTVMLFLLQYVCFSPLLVHFFVNKIEIQNASILLMCGVILFTMSDITLAYSLFKNEFKYSRFFVMSTYIFAQFFLVYGIILCR